MATKKSLTPKNKVVNHDTVTAEIPKLVFEPLMAEIDAWNERYDDSADPAYFAPDAFKLLTQQLIEDRLDFEKEAKPKEDKRGRRSDKSDKPNLHAIAQSA